jgi:hypothetical protein
MTLCSHCQEPRRGSASVFAAGQQHDLCHTDVGMDCYKLVTLRGHQLIDCPCKHGLQHLSPAMTAVIADYDTLQVDMLAGLASTHRALRAAEAVVTTLAEWSMNRGRADPLD